MKTKSILFIVGAMCFGAFLFGGITATMLNAQNEPSVPAPSFTPPTFSFQKNLKLGDNSQDIRQLQLVLNIDPATQISGTSAGSKGQESTYFGQLTQNAVMRFQAKYSKEVLDPYNIYAPTGFVGAATRGKLNKIIANLVGAPVSALVQKSTATSSLSVQNLSSIPASIPTSASAFASSQVAGPLPLAKELLPRLYTIRPLQVKRGETFILVGDGFQVENTVHIGTNVFTNVMPQDNSNISFTVPAGSNVPNGTYDVWVENSKGTSQASGQPISLLITDNPQPTSVISSVLPATVSGMDMVTVTGTGFTPTGNDILSGFGTIKDLSSNGTQITFSPRSLLSPEVVARIPVGSVIKVDFYVVNANGPSNVFGSVNLKI